MRSKIYQHYSMAAIHQQPVSWHLTKRGTEMIYVQVGWPETSYGHPKDSVQMVSFAMNNVYLSKRKKLASQIKCNKLTHSYNLMEINASKISFASKMEDTSLCLQFNL